MKILILFGHPAFQSSKYNKKMLEGLVDNEQLTIHDLYEEYPEMDIDIEREQKLLSEHDCIIFQHPMYWYSIPAIFREWQDLVLQHDWAFGEKGNALKGKYFFSAITTGGSRDSFSESGNQYHPVSAFLLPFYQMALHCKMKTLPPFVFHGTLFLSKESLENAKNQYHQIIKLLIDEDLDMEQVKQYEYINDMCKFK